LFLSSRKYDPGCSSRIRILTFYPSGSWIQGSKRHRIWICNTDLQKHALLWPRPCLFTFEIFTDIWFRVHFSRLFLITKQRKYVSGLVKFMIHHQIALISNPASNFFGFGLPPLNIRNNLANIRLICCVCQILRTVLRTLVVL
jgi:hypothetical protein